jgi:molecular chaperone DnaJ
MVQKRDFYEILGVGRNATQDELKQAYRKLAKKCHPDVNKDPDAEERFKEINEAYAILSDEKHRASYDRYGYAGVEGIPIDFDFSQFSDIFGGDFFSQFFGFGGMGLAEWGNVVGVVAPGGELIYDTISV